MRFAVIFGFVLLFGGCGGPSVLGVSADENKSDNGDEDAIPIALYGVPGESLSVIDGNCDQFSPVPPLLLDNFN